MNDDLQLDAPLVSELNALLTEHETEGLDQQQVERVRELLRTSKRCRSSYVQHQLVSAALAQPQVQLDAAAPQSSTETPLRKANTSPKWSRALVGLLAIATALLVAVAARWFVLEFSEGNRSLAFDSRAIDGNVLRPMRSVEATDTGVAVLAQSVDVAWASGLAPEIGEAVPTGTLTLDQGLIQLEFFCGATVVVEAPAEIELLSPMHAHVHRGKLRAQVPPAARGFKLDFHETTLIDLGTEFALDVDSESANVQVFDGEVKLQPGDEQSRLLVAGQAVEQVAGGLLRNSEPSPESFVGIADLQQRALAWRASRYGQWEREVDQLRYDPRLIALYTFEADGDWHRRLPNQAEASEELESSELDGAIVGASRVQGRWPEKSALEFKRPGDRVRIAIPGEFSSLSFSCWAKIDSLDRWFNSLFLTDGYNAGEPHWQILNSGRMYFSVLPAQIKQNRTKDFKSISPPFWKPSMSGKWIHLATTYNVPDATITHYVNGQQISQENVPERSLVATTRIGAASIGNWSQPTRKDAQFAIRNLNGSIDELAIFSAALTADEVMEIYEHGKP
ncbi:MAG: FecR domain-containing protein [Aureliella sp.]